MNITLDDVVCIESASQPIVGQKLENLGIRVFQETCDSDEEILRRLQGKHTLIHFFTDRSILIFNAAAGTLMETAANKPISPVKNFTSFSSGNASIYGGMMLVEFIRRVNPRRLVDQRRILKCGNSSGLAYVANRRRKIHFLHCVDGGGSGNSR